MIVHKPNLVAAWKGFLRTYLRVEGDRLDLIHGPLEKSIVASATYLASLSSDSQQDWLDAVTDDECDQVEQLIGVAFVIIQTYLTGVRSHVAVLSNLLERSQGTPLSFVGPTPKDAKRPKSKGLLRVGSPLMNSSAFTEVEVLNSVADYWKHREEWQSASWSKLPRQQQETADRVQVAGMTAGASGNLRAAAEAFGIAQYHDLSPIRDRARVWAENLYAKAQAET